jgi:hypothetical protein
MNKVRTILNKEMSTRFNFDTYKLVRHLERQGFSRGQSVALMRTMNAFLVDSTLSYRQQLLQRQETENQELSQNKALGDVKTELSRVCQNDSIKLDSEWLAREISQMEHTMMDKIISLKSDISLEMNQLKTDTKDEMKQSEMEIQQLQHKLVIKFADLKTLVETVKVELTTEIVWMTVATMGGLLLFDWSLHSLLK